MSTIDERRITIRFWMLATPVVVVLAVMTPSWWFFAGCLAGWVAVVAGWDFAVWQDERRSHERD